jgi:hypothetical protein
VHYTNDLYCGVAGNMLIDDEIRVNDGGANIFPKARAVSADVGPLGENLIKPVEAVHIFSQSGVTTAAR